MRNISVAVSDQAYERFLEIQKRKGFKNQSDCLEFVIETAASEGK